jgi:NLI interacting factor-like phosphatase
MGRGASYRPQYANDCMPPQPPREDVWCYGGDPSQYNRQGDYGSWRPQSFDAYAIVDAWRSYREDRTTLTEQHIDRTMNPTASEFSSAVALANHLQLQSNPHFKPYEPLRSVHNYARYPQHRVAKAPIRFSNRTSEAQLVKSFRNSGLNSSFIENRRNYSTTRVPEDEPIQSSSRDRPLPSIEPGTDYSLKAQAGFDESRRKSARRSTPRRTPQRTISPPVAPEASEVYLTQARLPPVRRSTPKKCLVILDLNGTCIARPNLFEPKVFKVRPGIHKLFDYLFEHHVVMIFTSMHPKNAAAIVDKLFTSCQREKLAAFWARDKLGLTYEQLHSKTQTYKNLIPIWLDRTIQSTHTVDEGRWGWDQSNTVLIDDSHLKAVSHPHNLLLVPEFAKKDAAKYKLHPAVERSEEAILQSLILKLEELKYQTDVSRLILQWQTGKAQVPQEPRSSLVMENKVKAPSAEAVQLLTLESTVDNPSEDSQDDEIHLKLSAQMKALTEDDERRKRGVSEIPETVWADLLQGTHTKS